MKNGDVIPNYYSYILKANERGWGPMNRDVTFLIVLIKFIIIMASSCIGVIKRESFFLFMDTQ